MAKYNYVGSALSPTTTGLIRDVLLTPPPDDPYDTLKRELLRHTTNSDAITRSKATDSSQFTLRTRESSSVNARRSVVSDRITYTSGLFTAPACDALGQKACAYSAVFTRRSHCGASRRLNDRFPRCMRTDLEARESSFIVPVSFVCMHSVFGQKAREP
ncbi:hypothetical protein HPB50_019515 [Hyalomma asiaticum]|uniref:Uncharacterized protein n=1 Tax=Hyalomma asiaticum TaxID=266040 RepID=A0ACB7SY39_HYAAI|nr:hypothetical protein HPB50_019515 [Hyalomma asiaticum]